MLRWGVLIAFSLVSVVGCSKKEEDKPAAPAASASAVPSAPVVAAPEPPIYLASLDSAERQEFYHLAEGGELLPLDLLHAVESVKTFKPFVQNLERFRLIADPADPDGLPVGMSVETIGGKRSEPRMVFLNCAACHVGQITYQGKTMRVDGAPGQIDVAGFIVELLQSIDSTIVDPKKFSATLTRLAERRHGKGGDALTKAAPDLKLPADKPEGALLGKVTELIEREKTRVAEKVAEATLKLDTAENVLRMLKEKLVYLERLRALQTIPVSGFGRLDAFMAARNLLLDEKYRVVVDSPVSLPPIYGLSKLTWYHYDNNTTSLTQRNIGENMGMGAVAHMKTGESTVIVRNLARLEEIAAKLPVPKWPEAVLGKIDAERAGRGAAIYKKECASCHDPEPDGTFPDRTYDLATIGTDENRAKSFINPVGDQSFADVLGGVLDKVEKKAFEREKVTPEEAAKMEPRKVLWRATGKYASRPLGGVWATAPYLHNGSVPTLYDLLLPPDKRPKTFLTGSREYDPKKVGFSTDGSQGAEFLFNTAPAGNKNTGHTYGTELSEDQRLDLLEYLKGL